MNPYIEIDIEKVGNNLKIINTKCCEYKYIYVDLCFINNVDKEIIDIITNNRINNVIVSNLNIALNIRRYNSSINIMIKDEVKIDEIYDAINNNIAISVYKRDYLEKINSLAIKDELNIYYLIDNYYEKFNYKKVLDIVNSNKYINLKGFYTILNDNIDNEYYFNLNNFSKGIKDYKNYEIFTNNILFHKKKNIINGIIVDIEILGFCKNNMNNFWNKRKINKIAKKNNDCLNITKMDKAIRIRTNIINRVNIKKNNLYIINGGINHAINKKEYYVIINNNKYNIEEIYYNYFFIYTNIAIKSDAVIYIDFIATNYYLFLKSMFNNYDIKYLNNSIICQDYL